MLYRDRSIVVAASAVATYIYSDRVPKGKRLNVQAVMARDKTSAITTSVEIGINQPSCNIPIDCTDGVFGANISHSIWFPFTVAEGERVYAYFTTPAASDTLELCVFGELEDM